MWQWIDKINTPEDLQAIPLEKIAGGGTGVPAIFD